MITVGLFDPISRWPYLRIAVRNIDQLKAGYDPGLDLICEGILTGTPFVYPAERDAQTEAASRTA